MIRRFVLVTLLVGIFLARKGSSQCFSNADCTGDVIPAADLRECCVGTDDGLSFSDSGSCTECVVHGFVETVHNIPEDGRLDTMFQLNVKGTTSLPLILAGTITAEAAGTAVEGDFEELAPITVRNNVAEIRLFTTNDEITLEYDDQVLLKFTPSNLALIPGVEGMGEFIRDTCIVNIIDNDLLEINFEESDYVISEDTSMLSSPIRLQFRQNQNQFSVTLSPVSVSAVEGKGLGGFINAASIGPTARATEVSDFTEETITITVPANQRTFQIEEFFTIEDDDVDEDDQSFAVVAELLIPEAFGCFQTKPGQTECFGGQRAQRGATEIRIMDNDPMIIGFTQWSQTVSEGRDGPTVDLFQLSIGVDTLRIAEREHGMIFRFLESSSTATVEPFLTQMDPIFDATFGSRDMIDGPLEERFFLLANFSDIRSLLTGIRNDFIPEGNECYTIAIFPVDVPGRRELFTCDRSLTATNYFCEHTICIVDEDPPFRVAFVETEYTVCESEGSVEVCVHQTFPEDEIFENYIIIVSAIDDTDSVDNTCNGTVAMPDEPDFIGRYPMANRTDYAQQTEFYNEIDDTFINDTMRRICYIQPIYDDLRLEDTEYFGLTLRIADSFVQATFGTIFFRAGLITIIEPMYDLATICIEDKNDTAVVGLEKTFYPVSEDVGVVVVCAIVYSPSITCPIEFPFSVSLSTTDRSAVSVLDYGALMSTILMFESCEEKTCTEITIVNDEIPETIESFFVTLDRTPDLDNRISLRPVDGEVQITDNDGARVGLEQTFHQVSEDVGVVRVCAIVYRPNGNIACPIDFAFDVELSTSDGDAVSTTDYGSVMATLMFSRCEGRSCVDVPITDDLVLENTESFSVALERNGLDSRIDLEPVDGEIEIIDNDVAVVGLEMTEYTVTEGALPAVEVCTVVYQPDISCPIAFPFSLTFNTDDSTAVVEEDYLDSDTIQLFGACARRRCIFVTIVDDNIPEVPERLLISIRDPSHPNITLNPDVGFIEIYEITTDIPPMVNDTLTGDPLMTVPVNTNPNVSTLCYEVHGHADKFFNLVSDTCVAVNAHYVDSGINNSRINLNVVDAIGVRAVNTQGNCVNIHVKLEGCAVTVEGLNISMFRNYSIVIRQYSNRVRISVPNCDDKDLVMWVFCKTGRTEDPVTWEYFSFNFLRFMVMRGLNLDERSHGLIGQFWNVPVTVTENTGTFQGRERDDDYVIAVGGRKFVGLLSAVTWEFEEKPCLYTGNSQAGPLGEHVLGPNGEDDINESVIEGMYKDYEVQSLFSPNFKYAHINEDNCMTK